jgi:serine/threonine protein kinase/WD40 repeat protein
MGLSPGTRLGPYEVVSPLGAGAMGEVYRARDDRLGRDVAVKVLPASVAADPGRLARFEREARALAALNHPNVGAIYGIEEADGQPVLVLELVEGPTLAELVNRASRRSADADGLPVAQVLAIAAQIAAALEAAHEKGIIHRDLKPANVKVGMGDAVKVLDFGLAKTAATTTSAGDQETRAAAVTEHGVVMGTPRYMSPEQVRGEDVGPQTDVWSFGCVLYEMLTGRHSFGGRTAADTMAAVLAEEPDWARLPVATPAPIVRLLRRCLRKDHRERLRHIGDARLEIDDARRDPADVQAAGLPMPTHARTVELRRLTDSDGLKETPALSPDGKMVAFTAVTAGWRQIWIQLVAGGATLQVTRDPVDHDEPRWTPDSGRLLFHVPAKAPANSGSIWEVSALGGVPRRLVSALNNGDLSHDGTRLAFFRRAGDRIELVVESIDGSGGRVIADLSSGPVTYSAPRWSPDGGAIAFEEARSASFETRVWIVPLEGGTPEIAVRADWIRGHAWRPDGTGLVYSASTGNTMPYPPLHNLRTVDRDGRGDRALTFGDVSYLEPDVRPPGHLVTARARSRSDVWLFPISGTASDNTINARRLTHQTGQVQTPSVNPDGSEFVYVSDHGGHSNLWIAAVDGSSVRQLTSERDPETLVGVAQWSPRGDHIVFISARRAQIGLRIIAPDGSGLRQFVDEGVYACWSGDGRWVYYTRAGVIAKTDVEDGTTRVVRREAAGPAITRDGLALYFVTRAEGDQRFGHLGWEVRRAEPEDGPSELIGRIEGSRMPFSPRFSPHAHLSPDGEWLAVPLTDGETTNLWLLPARGGAPRQITDFGHRATLIVRWVSWMPDGRHIVAAVAETDVDVVWLDGLV